MKYLRYAFLLCVAAGCEAPAGYRNIDGFTQGTTYHIIYRDAQRRHLQPAIDSLLCAFSKSLSVYDSTSIISQMNRNEPVDADDYFLRAFRRAREVYDDSNGAFDISAAPLFNAWGFGFKHRITVTPQLLDSLKTFVGMDKVRLKNRRLVKDDARITLNMNAIAQGYSVDVVSEWLEVQGIADYLVEIGGEIRCKGKNKKGKVWTVGIDKPEDGNNVAGEQLQAVVHFTGRAMVTSGNYRKFYMKDGKKYAHTIDPAMGRPVTHNLLSATVFADDAITADAYATVFMVVGLARAKEMLSQRPQWGAYLVYEEDGEMKTYITADVQAMIR
jgi:thiamine biosynthesis lipoprotein